MPKGSRVPGSTRASVALAGRRVLAGRAHALDRIDFLPSLAQVHLVLQAQQRACIAVGIELVVKLEDHAQRILGVGEGLQVPGGLSQEVSPLGDLQPQVRYVATAWPHRR